MLQGIYTALITPFKNGQVDEKAFAELVEWQIEQGVHGIVPCGTTGESATLSHEEHRRVIAIAIEVAKGRCEVMAGAGSNATAEAVGLVTDARKAGADSVLVVAPYYNKPTQEGLYQHYKAVQEAAQIPVVVYNIPGRSVVNISDDTLARLASLPHIKGVKDATGDLARVSTLRYRAGNGLALLSGEDMTMVGFNAMGGVGCISVASNVAPKACADIQNATLKGDYAAALRLHESLVPLHHVMFVESNPVPVKYALSLMGKCTPEVRLPLVELQSENKKRIEAAMTACGLM